VYFPAGSSPKLYIKKTIALQIILTRCFEGKALIFLLMFKTWKYYLVKLSPLWHFCRLCKDLCRAEDSESLVLKNNLNLLINITEGGVVVVVVVVEVEVGVVDTAAAVLVVCDATVSDIEELAAALATVTLFNPL
jgi:hypothetical protein